MKAIIGKSAKAATPISSHPLFPAIVALWFAALFGFGSLVLPTILIERAVDAVGLPSLIGATAPPLGFTAKLLIAAMAAAIGAVLGFVIARKVAASQKPEQQRQRGLSKEKAAKRPISAAEELGSDTLDAPVQPASAQTPDNSGRRRGLAINEEENAPSEFLQQAPLPTAGYDESERNMHDSPATGEQGMSFDPGFEEEETISFAQPQSTQPQQGAETVPTETGPVHLGREALPASEDELQFRPAEPAPAQERHFESKQVFQPQAPSAMVATTQTVPAEPDGEEFGNQAYQAPAAMDQYRADVQKGMPRLKIEPDPEPVSDNDFGFQPLEQANEKAAPPVNPQLEARLSGLSQELDSEFAPTSVLEQTLRDAKDEAAPQQVAQPAGEAPLAFSPPSLVKNSQEESPLELAQNAEPDHLADNSEAQDFSMPPARPFSLPKGFEDAQPLGAEPAPIAQFDPLAELSEQGEPVSPLQELHNQVEQAVTNDSQFEAEPQPENEIETQKDAATPEQPAAPAATAGQDEFDEDLPIMTDPISGQPLDALGTVELIERLAKSVRLRATGGTASSAIAAAMSAPEQVEEEAPEQPLQTDSESVSITEAAPAAPAEEPAQFAPPAQQFGKPQAFAAPDGQAQTHSSAAEDDFVPSALKPLDLDSDDEVDEVADSFSLPLGKPDAQPFGTPAPAPFSAPFAQPTPETQAEAHEESAFVAPKPVEAAPQHVETEQANTEHAEQGQAFPPIPQSFATQEGQPSEQSAQFDSNDDDEQPFGSLLELRNRLTQPQQFVRVEDEPVDETLAEPAVVFPGQGGQPVPQSAQAEAEIAAVPQPATEPEPQAPVFGEPVQSAGEPQQPSAPQGFTRRPLAEDASQMASAPAASQPQAPAAKDPAETERALRSALATLQRMSGAA